MWDGMIRGARLARAIGLALPLGLFLLWWQFYGNPGPIVGEGEASGVILEAHPSAYLVQLDAGPQVRIFRTANFEPGATVKLKVTRYASGTVLYALAAKTDLE